MLSGTKEAIAQEATTEDGRDIQIIEVDKRVNPNCLQYRPLLEKYTDWDIKKMLPIMSYESGGCNPTLIGDKTLVFAQGTKGMSCGLLQVRVLEGRPDCKTLQNVETNIDWGHKIWLTQGYGAWRNTVKVLDL